MWNYIDRLRAKPEATRRKYALGISAGIVAIIALIWFVSLMHRFNAPSEQAAAAAGPSPLSSLFQNIVQGYGTIKQNISDTNPFPEEQVPVVEPVATSTESTENGVIITDPGAN